MKFKAPLYVLPLSTTIITNHLIPFLDPSRNKCAVLLCRWGSTNINCFIIIHLGMWKSGFLFYDAGNYLIKSRPFKLREDKLPTKVKFLIQTVKKKFAKKWSYDE
jgi:hypothetical protein